LSDVRQRSVDINVTDLHGSEYRRVIHYYRTTFSGRIFRPERGFDGVFQIDVARGWTTKRKGREGLLEALRAALWVCVECGLNS